jgi:molybdopterin/thiamine biosynthesis adenylyltransferase
VPEAADDLKHLEQVEVRPKFEKRAVGVSYDLSEHTLRELDEHLVDRGYHLDNTLMTKLTRALIYYVEDTQLHNMGAPEKRLKRSSQEGLCQGLGTPPARRPRRHPAGVARIQVTDEQLLRYSRHILLDALGIEGQERILAAHALIIGAGGLGSPLPSTSPLPASAGSRWSMTTRVDFTNLQRQILHTQARVGMAKAESGRQALQAINPDIQIVPLQQRLAGVAALDELVASADVVLDCSDNFATRHAINRACVHHQKPLVSGAAIRFDGQISVYDLRRDAAPCYHCLFPEGEDVEEVRCAVMGVFAPLTGIIGTMQAAEALKLVAGIGEPLVGRLLLLDALDMEWRSVSFKKDAVCTVCGPKGDGRSGEYLRRPAAGRESAGDACRPDQSAPAG